jgi:NAD(P)H dehydrogenase (quinone)
MAKAIVIYYSQSGNTKQMAEFITEAMNQAGLDTACKAVSDVKAEQLIEFDAIVIGSPTYYGQMAAPIKQLFDDTIKNHGRLDGKIGAAFSSSANIGGGNETTVLSILQSMLIAGMVVWGDPKGDHYGPISIKKPDQRAKNECFRRGQRVAEMTLKLFK